MWGWALEDMAIAFSVFLAPVSLVSGCRRRPERLLQQRTRHCSQPGPVCAQRESEVKHEIGVETHHTTGKPGFHQLSQTASVAVVSGVPSQPVGGLVCPGTASQLPVCSLEAGCRQTGPASLLFPCRSPCSPQPRPCDRVLALPVLVLTAGVARLNTTLMSPLGSRVPGPHSRSARL